MIRRVTIVRANVSVNAHPKTYDVLTGARKINRLLCIVKPPDTIYMTETVTDCTAQYIRPTDRARCSDVAIVLAVAVIVISIGVHAPGHSYSYAQMRQMGATVGMIESGNWILPRNHEDRLARKPQLYSWLTAPVLLATGVYNDFTFRWPSVAASLGCAVLVYLLGLRWFGRRVGLLAALLWTTSLHMGKLMYLGTTDMLNAFWIMLAILCADRLLFARIDRDGEKRWVICLWASIVLGAMTKGWGIANLPLLAIWIALTTGLAPGFEAAREAGGIMRRILGGIALVWTRWRHAARRIRLVWGILAFAAVLGPIWGAMFYVGGDDFIKVIESEIFKRTVGGENAPSGSSAPTLVWLLFCTLPGSAFALGSLMFIRPTRWLANNSATALPLWWIIAVIVPFSLTHGFRPDYLLPCYVSVAILGAAGIDRLSSLGAQGGRVSLLRHFFAASVILICVFVMAAPLVYLCHGYLPAYMQETIRKPLCIAPETEPILTALAPIGLGLIAIAVWASLSWRIRTLAVVAVAAMLGVLFIDRHMISRHARTGDGEIMIEFAQAAKKLVGDDDFAVCGMEKVGTELYWGRFGKRVRSLDELKSVGANIRWLVTCDWGLTQLGACVEDPTSRYVSDIYGKDINGEDIHVRPDVGQVGIPVELNVNRPINEDSMGKIYLFRLQQ